MIPRYCAILVLTALLAVIYPAISVAQTNPTIDISLNQASFDTFVQTIESSTGYFFYFDKKETDSLHISIDEHDATLDDILQAVFTNTNFHFAVSADKKIFISRGLTITTSLPAGFYGKNKPVTDQSSDDPYAVLSEANTKSKLKVGEDKKLFEIGSSSNPGTGKLTLAGYVKDRRNGEAISGATVVVDSSKLAVTTDQYGYYAVVVPKGRHSLRISSAGMTDAKREIVVYSNGKLNIEMAEYIESLKTVIVSAEKKANTRSLQMGVNKLTIKAIKQVPVIFGEADVVKVVLALPGVTSVGEASSGFNVRGGSTDQNLILFNDATVYNPSHLFGFFSAFNPDVVKGLELYKSAIPEKYGGRLASVLDITAKEGNSKKWSGVGGIGPLTSKFTLEGPLKKDKTTMVLSGRTTYSNWLLRQLKDVAYKNSSANFYDLNFNVSHQINASNSLYLTSYLSNDQFAFNKDTTYKYSNKNINVKWKHIFNNNFNGLLSAGIDQYNYSVQSDVNPLNAYKLSFGIRQNNLRAIFNYTPNNTHTFNFGFSTTLYDMQPGTFEPTKSQSLVSKNVLMKERALESALFIGDQVAISSKLSVNLGLRYSLYNMFGAKNVYSYANGAPRTVNSITDTVSYGSGKNVKTYHGPEVRVSMRYSLSDNTSIKLSYNSLLQYIHLLSNTTAISPTDIWKLSDSYIKPQKGQQLSLGLYRNFKSNTIETSIEIYYKKTNNFLDYKSGASLLLNKHIETELFTTRGKAYGAELLIKKNTGRVNGWLSYTYSRTLLQMNDPLAGELINKGNYYPASFDKPHNVNVIFNYRFSHRYSISTNFVYSTGRPITLPLAVFNIGGAASLLYSERNEYRIPDYMRADFSLNIDGNHKLKQRIHNSWSVGVYNMLARQNAYSVYFLNVDGKVKGYQLSIFGTAIPFITYNFRF